MNNAQKEIIRLFLEDNLEYSSLDWQNNKAFIGFTYKPNKIFTIDDFTIGSPTHRVLTKITKSLVEAG